ncbi:hypothetical protein [Reyranella sp.]|uniref:hypothetical protein n=1 Tax=Reyranella sp. TaxID=1929291 RepID=UPI00272FEEA0|nr:hypothetical protein [Reyranella sp.]MDP2372301.1 hypothetical protein [Reyranella sp.]
MSDPEMHPKVGELTDILLSVPDEIGLYEICSDLKYDLHISDENKIKRITLDVVREMLHRGARVGFDCGVPTGRHNPEKTPDEIVGRIDREWAELKALPTIGDICTFVWTPAAMEAYRK